MAKYLVWSNDDPNDGFEVEADSAEDAAIVALAEVGWAVSAEPVSPEAA